MGFTGEHVALALQLAVAMATACTLHVVHESYVALHERTIWVVVTGGCSAAPVMLAVLPGVKEMSCFVPPAGFETCLPLSPRSRALPVAVILESAVGGLVLKSGLRTLGTSLAGLLGMG